MKTFVENVRIRSIVTAVPRTVRTVDEFVPQFGAEWKERFVRATGVESFHVAEDSQTTGDLAFHAAERALKACGWARDSVDALIFVSQTPDYTMPATACILQDRLRLSQNVLAFDVNLGCSGFPYGLFIAASLCRMPHVRRVLFLGGDTLSKIVSPLDQSTAALFGDAGFAVAVECDPESTERWTCLFKTDGSGAQHIIVPAGGARQRFATTERQVAGEGISRSPYDLAMNGPDVFSFTINEVPQAITELMQAAGVAPDAVDALVLHQANKFILKQIASATGFKMAKVPVSLDRYGNTSVATIPLTLCDKYGTNGTIETLRTLGTLETSQMSPASQESPMSQSLVLGGFGIGLSWAVIHLRLDPSVCQPIIVI